MGKIAKNLLLNKTTRQNLTKQKQVQLQKQVKKQKKGQEKVRILPQAVVQQGVQPVEKPIREKPLPVELVIWPVNYLTCYFLPQTMSLMPLNPKKIAVTIIGNKNQEL